MKKINLIIVCLALGTTLSFAQSKQEVAVNQAVNQLTEALLSGDRAALTAVAADELTYGHSSGAIEDKAAFVEAVASGKTDFTKIDISDQTISVVGKIALVRHKMSADLGSTHVNLGILTVWTKQKGGWKLLARQAYRI
ncbi:MAG: nuclear transport factor 2 family protein [Saprospiraceae bacterium]|nr:nuclear transport factor 2 family protein [Saprospiraceae bacterium]